MATRHPETLQEAILYFAEYQHCHDALVDARWPHGVVRCPRCGSDRVRYLSHARVWKCYEKHPRPKFSLKVGTIFEDSPLPLQKWLPALWLLCNCKNGISSYELARALNVTQKTGWFMLSRLRLALQGKAGGKLGGDVEVDETYIGAKARNMHKDKRARVLQGKKGGLSGKVAVMGLLQRNMQKGKSRVETRIVGHNDAKSLAPVVRERVEPKSRIYTDNLSSYDNLWKDGYAHMVISHADIYAIGQVHTNGMENFWSLLKRSLNGTYVSVEPFHLFRYLDEQAFRFNERSFNDQERFYMGLNGILGKRLTYTALTGSELPQT